MRIRNWNWQVIGLSAFVGVLALAVFFAFYASIRAERDWRRCAVEGRVPRRGDILWTRLDGTAVQVRKLRPTGRRLWCLVTNTRVYRDGIVSRDSHLSRYAMFSFKATELTWKRPTARNVPKSQNPPICP